MSSTPPSEEPMTNNTTSSDFGWNLHQTLTQLIGFADTKAGALLGASAIIIVLLLPNKPTLSIFGILALVCLAFCALCAGCAFLPFLPFRSRGNEEYPVFWKWIRREQLNKYEKLVGKLDNSKVNMYYARENYQISKDLLYRFTLVECSIVFLIFGLVFGALFFLIPLK
jgi:hypothetical protein